MDNDDVKILELLNKIPEITEADAVHTYSAVRKVSGGEPYQKQILTISILDAGPGVRPEFRFLCEVRSDDGKVTCSNQESRPELALFGIHWSNLDPPPPPKERHKDFEESIRRIIARSEKEKAKARPKNSNPRKARKRTQAAARRPKKKK